MKRRTILNVQKKRRQKLYAALADAETFAEARESPEEGVPGMEDAIERYRDAVSVLEKNGVSRDALTREKAELYNELAELNREIREQRRKLAMCAEIQGKMPEIEANLRKIEPKRRERRTMRISR